MAALVECEGVPRDLGRDQGAACAEAIRAAAGAPGLRRIADRLGRFDRASGRWLRDVQRHFPHQGEWTEGLARAAGVPGPALVRAMRAALRSDASAIAVAVVAQGGVQVARTATQGSVLRRMRPEGRFISLEIGPAVLTAPAIGLNEAGLAVAVVAGIEAAGACAASAALLVRDCLERFDSVESALAWCLGRPAASDASILLSDPTGEIAGVEFRAGGRRVARPDGGVLLLAGAGCDVATLEKSLAAAPDRDDFEAVLAAVLNERAVPATRIHPAERSLRAGSDAPVLTP